MQGPKAPSVLICDAKINGTYLPEFLDRVGTELPPIVVVSDFNDSALISSCIEFGVKDYLLKPIDSEMLIAKVKGHIRALRRTESRVGLNFDIFNLSITNETGAKIRLTHKEFQILELITKSHPEGLSPAELRKKIWGTMKVVNKTLDVHLFKLRRKLGALNYQVRFNEKHKYIIAKD